MAHASFNPMFAPPSRLSTGAPASASAVPRIVARDPKRFRGVDFAKGALVLVMVLYHWMNYFIGLDSVWYKYLRFLTPSFIFLAGFLIAQIYVFRYAARPEQISARLTRRGLKLLAIVLFLNVAVRVLGTGMAARRLGSQSLTGLAWAYLTGVAPVAFSVLVPIGYLLILSAALLIASRGFHTVFHWVSVTLVMASLTCEWMGLQNGYLEMLAAGMLGATAGHLSVAQIERAVGRWTPILAVYAIYAWAVTFWNQVYAVQIIGVCVNLSVFYRLGESEASRGYLGRVVIRLGEYSLFAYIAQIFIIQLLRKSVQLVGAGSWMAYAALLAAAILTALGVEAVHRLRRRWAAADLLYRAVFV